MKYCVKCGAELVDEAVICTKCGCATENYRETTLKKSNSKNNSNMKNVAKIFMIISTVFMGLYLLPLAWTLPMTLAYSRKIENGEEVSTSFKVCTLLFVSLIAGIIMLCDNE